MKRHVPVTASFTSCLVLALVTLASCEDDDGLDGPLADAGTPADSSPATDSGEAGSTTVAHTLFATEGETLVSFDVATGSSPGRRHRQRQGAHRPAGHRRRPRAGEPDRQQRDAGGRRPQLPGGARINSLVDLGATRPVHSFITPKIAGKQFWAANNDGAPGMAATNSVVFIDLVPGSATHPEGGRRDRPGHRAPQGRLEPGQGPGVDQQHRRLRQRHAGHRLQQTSPSRCW